MFQYITIGYFQDDGHQLVRYRNLIISSMGRYSNISDSVRYCAATQYNLSQLQRSEQWRIFLADTRTGTWNILLKSTAGNVPVHSLLLCTIRRVIFFGCCGESRLQFNGNYVTRRSIKLCSQSRFFFNGFAGKYVPEPIKQLSRRFNCSPFVEITIGDLFWFTWQNS